MKNSEEVSNTFFIHSFIAISTLILIYGSVFAVVLINIIGNIVSSDSTSQSPLIIITGVVCLALMPYCFPIFKSLEILEVVGANLLLHPPLFVNDMNHPSEIALSQITNISRDKVFNNLVEITFIEGGDEQIIYSFIKKGKLDVIKGTAT